MEIIKKFWWVGAILLFLLMGKKSSKKGKKGKKVSKAQYRKIAQQVSKRERMKQILRRGNRRMSY